nr:hypothetical protein [Mycobacterium lepromatosis]
MNPGSVNGLHCRGGLRHPRQYSKSLSPGGFQDLNSELACAIQVLTDKFGQNGQHMLTVVTAPAGAVSEQASTMGTGFVAHLQRSSLT